MELRSGYNLPDGCFESDLPGNSRAEMAAQNYAENLGEDDLAEFVANEFLGDLIYEDEDDGCWVMEDEDGEIITAGNSEETAIARFVDEREEFVIDAMVERYYEEVRG